MHEFWKFIKRTWWLFLILFFAPIIIILIFFIDEYVLHNIDMSAGEWANLLGSTFGYWGTVLLGVLAFWQNERATLINEKLYAFEDINKKTNNTPKLKILGCEIFSDKTYEPEFSEENNFRGDYNYFAKFKNVLLKDGYIDFYILLKNDSLAEIYNLTYNGFGYLAPKKRMFRLTSVDNDAKFGEKQINIDHIDNNSEVYINIHPSIQNGSFIYSVHIKYCNIFLHEFSQLIQIVNRLQ